MTQPQKTTARDFRLYAYQLIHAKLACGNLRGTSFQALHEDYSL